MAAVAIFYVSHIISHYPFEVEHVGYEFEYPPEHDRALSRESLIMAELGRRLAAEGGLYPIHQGSWHEVLYVASSPDACYIDSHVADIYRRYVDWDVEIDRYVSWPEFVQLVRSQVR